MRPPRLIRMSFGWGSPISRFLIEGRHLLRHGRCPALAASSLLDTRASQLRVHHLAIPQHRSRPKRGKAWNVRPACRAEGSPDGPRLTARGWRCAVAFFSWSNRRPHCDRCRSSQGAAVPTLAFALVWSWHASIGPESKRLARIAPSLTQHRCCIAPVGANPAFASCRLRPRIAGPWVFRVWYCDGVD